MRGGSLSLRALLLVSVGLAVALVFVPFQRLAADLVALTAEGAERREAARIAALAARALEAGATPGALVGDGVACVCAGPSCTSPGDAGEASAARRAGAVVISLTKACSGANTM